MRARGTARGATTIWICSKRRVALSEAEVGLFRRDTHPARSCCKRSAYSAGASSNANTTGKITDAICQSIVHRSRGRLNMEQLKRWFSSPVALRYRDCGCLLACSSSVGRQRPAQAAGPGAGKGGAAKGGAGGSPHAADACRVDTSAFGQSSMPCGQRGASNRQAVELRSDEHGELPRDVPRGSVVSRGAPTRAGDDAMLRAQDERADAERDLARQQLARVQRCAIRMRLRRQISSGRRHPHAPQTRLWRLSFKSSEARARAVRGVVGQRFVSVGDYVTTRTPLLTLQTIDPQRAVIEVPERHATALKLG